jgi:hypothetical protein
MPEINTSLRDAAQILRGCDRDGNELRYQVANWLEFAAMRGPAMPGRPYAQAVADAVLTDPPEHTFWTPDANKTYCRGCGHTLYAGNHGQPCHAEIRHGPGHQSRTRCGLKGPHEVHFAVYMGQEATWRGDKAYSGVLDEPPMAE